MQRIMMIALLAAFAMPVIQSAHADDMNPTDTRAEFAARKANHGRYNPAMHKGEHKKAWKHHHHKMMKKAAVKKAGK
jgi:hypothetical protein